MLGHFWVTQSFWNAKELLTWWTNMCESWSGWSWDRWVTCFWSTLILWFFFIQINIFLFFLLLLNLSHHLYPQLDHHYCSCHYPLPSKHLHLLHLNFYPHSHCCISHHYPFHCCCSARFSKIHGRIALHLQLSALVHQLPQFLAMDQNPMEVLVGVKWGLLSALKCFG